MPANGTIGIPKVIGPVPTPPPRIYPLLQLKLLDTVQVPGTDVAIEIFVCFVPK